MSLSNHPTILASQGVLANTTIPYIWDLSNTHSIISTTDVMDMYTDCIAHDIVNSGTQAFGLTTEYTSDIDTYFISPAYELSSGTSDDYYSSSFSDLQDITFDKTGTVCMLVGHDGENASNYIVYDVSPPFDFQNGATLRLSNSEGPSRVISVELSPDGDKIIGLTEDGTSIVSWNMYEFNPTTMYNYQINTLLTGINDIAVNQNGTQLITVGDSEFSLYTFGTPYDIQTLTHVYDIAIPDSGFDKTITVRNDGTTIQVGDYTNVKTFVCSDAIIDTLINYGVGFYADNDYILYTGYETMTQTGVGTVAFNIKLNTSGDYKIYNDVENSEEIGINCRTYADGRLNASMYRGVVYTSVFGGTTASGVLQEGVSHSVVIVHDYPTGMRIYVDNVEVLSVGVNDAPNSTGSSTQLLAWGYNYNDTSLLMLDGVLGNIAISENNAWSVSDVDDYYNGIVPSSMTYGIDTYIPCSDGRGNRFLQNVMNFSDPARLNLISGDTYHQREVVVDFPSYARIYGYNELDGYVSRGDIYEGANVVGNLEEIEFEIFIDADYSSGTAYGALFSSFDSMDTTARFLSYGNFTGNLTTETFGVVTDGIAYMESTLNVGLRRIKLVWNTSTSVYDIYVDGSLQPTLKYTTGTILSARQFIVGMRSLGTTARPTAITYLRINSDILIDGKTLDPSMVNNTDGTTCYFLAKCDGSGVDVNGNNV